MRRSSGGYRAMQFETVVGSATREAGFADRYIYAIADAPGMYRRVADPGVSDYPAAGVVPAWYDDKLVYLTLDVKLIRDMEEVGVQWTAATPEDIARANAAAIHKFDNPPPDLLTGIVDDGGGSGGIAPPAAPTGEKKPRGRRAAVNTAPPSQTWGNPGGLVAAVAADQAAQEAAKHAAAQDAGTVSSPGLYDMVAQADQAAGAAHPMTTGTVALEPYTTTIPVTVTGTLDVPADPSADILSELRATGVTVEPEPVAPPPPEPVPEPAPTGFADAGVDW